MHNLSGKVEDFTELLKKLGNVHEVIESTQILYQKAGPAKLSIAGRRGVLDRISQRLKFKGSLFFIESSSEKILESLHNMTCEIGITHMAPDSHEFMAKPLFKEEFHLLIPKTFIPNHPNISEKLFSTLKQFPCLGYKPNDEILRTVCSYYLVKPTELKMFRATENYNSLKEMVIADMGWAVIPSYLKVPSKDTWAIPISNKVLVNRQFFLIWRTEFSSVPWFKDLILEIQNCFR